MIAFEDIVGYLKIAGVKSLHIELDGRQLSMEEEERIAALLKPAGEHTCKCSKVPADEDPGVAEERREFEAWKKERLARGSEKTQAAKAAPQDVPPKVTQEDAKKMQELRAAAEAQFAKDKAVEAEKPSAVAEKPAQKPAVEKVADAEPKGEKPVGTVWEQLAEMAGSKGGTVSPEDMRAFYFTLTKVPPHTLFRDMNILDKGDITRAHRIAVIDCMTREDFQRVNNDFSLGIDTDRPDGQIRLDMYEAF